MPVELEEFNEIFKIIDSSEEEKGLVYVGQINTTTKDGMINISAVVSFYYDEYVIRYAESIGGTIIPNEEFQNSENEGFKMIYNQQKSNYDKLINDVKTKKAEWIANLQSKNFVIVKGVAIE